MAVRIYSLAKELKLDSKDLVDLCTKAGVAGKGSAPASLTDEEAAKVRTFVAGGSKTAARPAAAKSGGGVGLAAPPESTVMRREDYVAPAGVSGKPQVLAAKPAVIPPSPKPAPLASRSSLKRDAAKVEAPPAESEAPPAIEPAAEQPIAAEIAPTQPSAPSGEDAPMTAPPMTDIPRRPIMIGKKASDGTRAPRQPTPRSSGPVVRVAPLPTSSMQTPTPTPTSNEPAPQKPDLRLPIDAIRAGKLGGNKPLQAHMRAHEAKRKNEQQGAQPAGPGGSAAGRGRGPGGPGRGGATAPSQMPPSEKGGDRKVRTVKVAGSPEDDKKLLGGREARQANRKRSQGDGKGPSISGDDEPRFRKSRKPKRTGTNTAAPRKGNVIVQIPCNVRSLSEALGFRVAQVLGKLLQLGTMANINTEVSAEMIELLAIEFGVEIELRQAVSLEDEMLDALERTEDAPEEMQPRPPVVTFLGHVDHGKTSLLDRIIGINVAKGESGGITQHIRAYRIDKDGRSIAFVDTPGHEAFTEMRARGANVTDIAVLVVAADDGVMPQTEEAISHARAAGVPIVIALNKTDLPGVNYDRIYTQLVTAGLQPTEWGGDVELVKCSALTGAGIDELLDTLLTIAELHDYRANPNRAGFGTCLEASLHEGRGVVTKMIVQNGTLRVGDIFVCGTSFGRVKAMYDTLDPNKTYTEAGPSQPINLTGLDEAPAAGEHFYVLDDISKARDIAGKREQESREIALSGIVRHVTLENLHDRLNTEQSQSLNLILRADVRGSIEAIQKELGKLAHPEVHVRVLQATVGGVTEADVQLAAASDAIIIAFNVVPDDRARSLALDKGVEVRRYDIIYQVTDDLKLALEGMLKPERREVELGRALVQKTFSISRVGTIAGCRVLSGTIERSNARVRVIRDNRVVGDYHLDTLKREKDDAKEVREGFECGIKLSGFNDLKDGDILEVYRIEEIQRKLEL